MNALKFFQQMDFCWDSFGRQTDFCGDSFVRDHVKSNRMTVMLVFYKVEMQRRLIVFKNVFWPAKILSNFYSQKILLMKNQECL